MPGLQSIEGIISNLKTTDIVNAMIALERRPVTLMEDRQATKTNEISSFKALSAKLLALKTTLAKLKSESDFSQAAISVSDETLLSATAKKALPSGVYAINILSLAKNHQIASQGFDDATGEVFGTGTINGNKTINVFNVSEKSLDPPQVPQPFFTHIAAKDNVPGRLDCGCIKSADNRKKGG